MMYLLHHTNIKSICDLLIFIPLLPSKFTMDTLYTKIVDIDLQILYLFIFVVLLYKIHINCIFYSKYYYKIF